jgi:PAS domain S-box-containing protein
VKNSSFRVAVRIALVYVVFGGLWILLSDRALEAFSQDLGFLTHAQTVKGWAFVLASGILIFFLVRHSVALRQDAQRELASREDSQRQSEARFSTLFEKAPYALALSRLPEGVIEMVNESFEELFGYSRQEVIGRTSLELGINPDEEGRARLLAAMQAHGSARDEEMVLFTKSGQPRDVSVNIDIVEIENQRYLINAVQDITERKGAEKNSQRNQQLLELFVEHSPAAIAMFDCQMRYIVASRRYLMDYQLGDQKLAGRSHYEMFPEIPARWKEIHQRCLAGAIEKAEQDPFLRSDGRLDWVRWEIRPWRELSGEIGGVILFSEVITEFKQAKENLKKKHKELSTLYFGAQRLQKLRDPIAMAQEIIKVMDEALDYTYCDVLLVDEESGQLEPFAFHTKHLNVAVGEAAQTTLHAKKLRVGRGITGWVAEHGESVRLGDVHTDARYISLRPDTGSKLCVPLKLRDRVTGVINLESAKKNAYLEDDQHLLETIAVQIAVVIQNTRLFEQIQGYAAQLEQRVAERTAQLTLVNQELEAFSYSISHDLRAPLRAIGGFSSIIARRHRQNLNEEGQHYIDNIVQASKYMDALIDDLLGHLRLGRVGVRREQVSLANVIAQVASHLQARLDGLGGALEIQVGLPTVMGDAALLNQVFSNLLENAATYHRPDCPLVVRVSHHVEDGSVIISVSDNGIGIPAEYHDKIFDIFQRLHNQDEYPGTGIGLATVKKALELIGGEVWLTSSVGEGSAFYVRLPKE